MKNRLAGLAAGIAILASGSVAIRNFQHPYAVYGGVYSDHFSHLGSTILFAAKGLDIYRRPVNANLTQSHAQKDVDFAHSNGLGTAELYVNPLDPDRPPLAINWSFQIRPYPPGVYLLYAPLAVLFQHEVVGFAVANRIIILFLVLTAGLTTYLLFEEAFTAGTPGALAIRSVIAAVCAYWCCLWAVRGFYDELALLLTVLSLRNLGRRSWLNAFCWYCGAVFLHFRALYYFPAAVIAFAGLFRERGGAGLRDALKQPKLWGALVAAAASFVCFVIALPQLEGFGRNNPFYHLASTDPSQSVMLAMIAIGFVLMGLGRDFMSALFLGCYSIFLIRTPQTYAWHTLFLVPLVLYSSRQLSTVRAKLQSLLILTLCVYLGYWVYGVRWETFG